MEITEIIIDFATRVIQFATTKIFFYFYFFYFYRIVQFLWRNHRALSKMRASRYGKEALEKFSAAAVCHKPLE